jgi:host factor-I protein
MCRVRLTGRQKIRGTHSMAAEKQQNLQDVFLNHVRKNKIPVTVFLINGVKLQGVISSFDNFCLLLRRDGHVQLVYKHAVSTVMPSAAVRLYDPGATAGEEQGREGYGSSREAAPREAPARDYGNRD